MRKSGGSPWKREAVAVKISKAGVLAVFELLKLVPASGVNMPVSAMLPP